MPGQIPRQIQHAAHLARRQIHGPAKLFFSGIELPALVGQLRLGEVAFSWVPLGDSFGDCLRLVVAAAQKARSLQIIIEQIVQRFLVVGIQRDGFLEVRRCALDAYIGAKRAKKSPRGVRNSGPASVRILNWPAPW